MLHMEMVRKSVEIFIPSKCVCVWNLTVLYWLFPRIRMSRLWLWCTTLLPMLTPLIQSIRPVFHARLPWRKWQVPFPLCICLSVGVFSQAGLWVVSSSSTSTLSGDDAQSDIWEQKDMCPQCAVKLCALPMLFFSIQDQKSNYRWGRLWKLAIIDSSIRFL